MTRNDLINMVCGSEFGFYTMGKIWEVYGKNLCGYSDKTGLFKWNRHVVSLMPADEIMELYELVKNWNKDEKKQTAYKKILFEASNKKCWYECSMCGYSKIAEEDNFCSNCGSQLNTK